MCEVMGYAAEKYALPIGLLGHQFVELELFNSSRGREKITGCGLAPRWLSQNARKWGPHAWWCRFFGWPS